MTASLSFQSCYVFYGQPAAEILMLLLYFREGKKGIDTYFYLKYIYIYMHAHTLI